MPRLVVMTGLPASGKGDAALVVDSHGAPGDPLAQGLIGRLTSKLEGSGE